MSKKHNIWSLSLFDETSSSPSVEGGAKQMSPPASTCKGSPCRGQVLTNVLHSQIKLMIDLGHYLKKSPEARKKNPESRLKNTAKLYGDALV